MRKWICHPLQSIGEINRRLDAVEEFRRHPELVGMLRGGLQKLPDLERLISMICTFTCSSNVASIPFLSIRVQRRKVYNCLVMFSVNFFNEYSEFNVFMSIRTDEYSEFNVFMLIRTGCVSTKNIYYVSIFLADCVRKCVLVKIDFLLSAILDYYPLPKKTVLLTGTMSCHNSV